ncbi:MAG: AAA family ATPase [Pseudomonadota bacterium]
MSLSSLNTRDSAVSPHALSFMRPPFRRIALWHRDRVAELRPEPDADFDIDDIETEDPQGQTSAERLEALALPLELRINAPYSATSAASLMSPAEIAEALSEGHDPWAEEAKTFRNGQMHQPPIRTMSVAARFAALFQTADIKDEMTRSRAMTRVEVESAETGRALYNELARILPWLSELSDPLEDTSPFFDVSAWGAHEADTKTQANQRRIDYEKSVSSAVRQGQKVLCIASAGAPMSAVERALSERIVQLPPLTTEICIELLRTTHTVTGQLAEDEIRKRLPTSAELSELPLAVLEGAFREKTTIAVADALALSAQRLRTPSGTTRTTLEDIVLNEDVADHVDRLVHDVALWKVGNLDWKDVSSSILLFGPPGNGKTLLASALAGSLSAELISTSYSDCQKHGHQGDMLRALSDKVEEAIRKRPFVFFLDELDSFTHRNAPKRNSDYIVGVVNGLLEHLNRLNETPDVVVLGATNYPDSVDPAIIRPGRFDVHLEIGNPDKSAISKILLHALGRTDDPIDVANVTDSLLGSSGAQVVALVKEAKGLARREGTSLENRHLVAVVDRIRRPLDGDTEWRTAVHEAGHIVVSHCLGLPAPVKASMSRFGGSVDVPSRPLESRQTARDRIAALLGGRAAEIVVLEEAMNGAGIGAQSDLAFATRVAEKTLFEWGLGGQLAFTSVDLANPAGFAPNAIKEIDALLHEQQERVIRIADQHQDDIDRIARALLKERELSAARLLKLLSPVQKTAAPPDNPSPS